VLPRGVSVGDEELLLLVVAVVVVASLSGRRCGSRTC